MKNALRFPKLENKTLKGKISEYEKNWDKAEQAVKKGQPICLSDLIGQAENIYLTRIDNTGSDSKENRE